MGVPFSSQCTKHNVEFGQQLRAIRAAGAGVFAIGISLVERV